MLKFEGKKKKRRKSVSGSAKKAEKRLWVMNRKYKHSQKKLMLEKEKLKAEMQKSRKLQKQLDVGKKQCTETLLLRVVKKTFM